MFNETMTIKTLILDLYSKFVKQFNLLNNVFFEVIGVMFLLISIIQQESLHFYFE